VAEVTKQGLDEEGSIFGLAKPAIVLREARGFDIFLRGAFDVGAVWEGELDST
jgi:hypothetical protein